MVEVGRMQETLTKHIRSCCSQRAYSLVAKTAYRKIMVLEISGKMPTKA